MKIYNVARYKNNNTVPSYVELEDPFLFPFLDADFLLAGAEFSCGLE